MGLNALSLYPSFGIRRLRSQREGRWAELVDQISHLPPSDPRVMAFSLTVRRLRRDLGITHTCNDPLCAVCAADILARYRGGEKELINLYNRNLKEMHHAIRAMRIRPFWRDVGEEVA